MVIAGESGPKVLVWAPTASEFASVMARLRPRVVAPPDVGSSLVLE